MIIVTGAAGFIGSRLAERLNLHNYNDLVLVDDFSRADKKANYHQIKCSQKVERTEFPHWLRENENQVQFIFHLGARTDTTEQDVEIFNTLNLNYSKEIWNLCVEFGIALIYASSAATYGDGALGYSDAHEIVEDLKPLNPYGASKNDFDKWALQQSRSPYFYSGLKFFNVFGPNENHKSRMASVVLHTYRQVNETGQMKLFRSHRDDYQDGHQTRDFVYVDDVCDVCMYMMHHRLKVKSGLYNLGSGNGRTFLDLVKATFYAMVKEQHIVFIDTPQDIRDTYQYFTEADLSKLRETGYTSEFTKLEDGIEDYVKNYLDKLK
ncbi:MAG: ADP-glyceromanno-heptose 6-epimerase [Flavobacteriales bacterium]